MIAALVDSERLGHTIVIGLTYVDIADIMDGHGRPHDLSKIGVDYHVMLVAGPNEDEILATMKGAQNLARQMSRSAERYKKNDDT